LICAGMMDRRRSNRSPRFHKYVVGVLRESSAGSEWASGGGIIESVSVDQCTRSDRWRHGIFDCRNVRQHGDMGTARD
jgi:hypothetical protein